MPDIIFSCISVPTWFHLIRLPSSASVVTLVVCICLASMSDCPLCHAERTPVHGKLISTDLVPTLLRGSQPYNLLRQRAVLLGERWLAQGWTQPMCGLDAEADVHWHLGRPEAIEQTASPTEEAHVIGNSMRLMCARSWCPVRCYASPTVTHPSLS